MFVIKIKNKKLFYNNRNDYGFHENINKADVYNSRKGASIALGSLRNWYNLGAKDASWRRDFHDHIKNFDVDVEIREVEIKLK